MNLLSWIVFGFITGVVAHLIDPADKGGGGFLGTLILGILGALVGGLLANLVFGLTVTGFNVTSFVVAILGSLLLLFIQRAVRKV